MPTCLLTVFTHPNTLGSTRTTSPPLTMLRKESPFLVPLIGGMDE
jgi:hypothetical protein